MGEVQKNAQAGASARNKGFPGLQGLEERNVEEGGLIEAATVWPRERARPRELQGRDPAR